VVNSIKEFGDVPINYPSGGSVFGFDLVESGLAAVIGLKP